MSRDFRDDVSRPDPDPTIQERTEARERLAPDRSLWVSRIELPRTPDRRPVILGRNRFMLRHSESELLETVGTFRAIAVRDFTEGSGADIRSLRDQGLLHSRGLVMNGRPERVALLTRTGRELVERSREERSPVGRVKSCEIEHDAQLYRMFLAERQRLEADRATITRVVLEYQLTADYHRFVHEQERAGVDANQAKRAFADTHELPFGGGGIHLPDVRVEYETTDGRTGHRDLELATEHYSRAQIGAKLSVGFRVYRAAGARPRGGPPSDPHHLEWIT